MNVRGFAAVSILAAWGVGIAVFAQRELSRSPRERLAEAAARVAPGATYFAVEREGKHVGFASTTIDTIPGGLQATDYFVADLAVGGTVTRANAQSVVHLSRALALRDFTVTFGADSQVTTATGRTSGDTLLEYTVRAPATDPVTTRVPLSGPILLPTLVPLAVALGSTPKVGKSVTIDTFDPATMTMRPVTVRIAAESSFVVMDSATYDGGTRRWVGVHADTVHGWRIVAGDGGAMDVWADELGRMVALRAPAGFALRRAAYEIAFENWRTSSPLGTQQAKGSRDDLWSSTAIAAGATLAPDSLASMRLRLGGIDLSRLQLATETQSVSGDTVLVRRDGWRSLMPAFPLPPNRMVRARYANELRPEPLLEVEDPTLVALATRLRGRETRTDVVARRIMEWVHDSLAKEPTVSIPSAAATLRSRRGDCTEHTQLFVALARAAGIPARAVSGMVHLDGKFYYHAWAEVQLQHWVPIDPTFGQLPADASHVRMLTGGLLAQTELARVIGRLTIEVLDTETVTANVQARAERRADHRKRHAEANAARLATAQEPGYRTR